jgi:hypothetical protein
LTSETTSGTSGSIRQAEELSMTVTPAAANFGASAREVVAPGGEDRDVEAGRVGGRGVLDDDVAALPGIVVPAERAEAKSRSCPTGKLRSARIRSTTPPTWPVAPTTPTLT